jgi:hypothetical protein
MFEFAGQTVLINQASDFTSEVMDKLKLAFNNLSSKELN